MTFRLLAKRNSWRLLRFFCFTSLGLLPGPSSWSKSAEKIYREAESAEYRLRNLNDLQKKRYRSWASLLAVAEQRYYETVRASEPLWSLRAAYRLTTLVEDGLLGALFGESHQRYRDFSLPSPFDVKGNWSFAQSASAFTLAQLNQKINQLYQGIKSQLVKGSDPELEFELNERIKSRQQTQFFDERLSLPWETQLKTGVVIYEKGRFWAFYPHGIRWRTVDPNVGLKAIFDGLNQGVHTIAGSYALVAAAQMRKEWGDELNWPDNSYLKSSIQLAIKHPKKRVRLAGIVAAQKFPLSDLSADLTQALKKAQKVAPRPLFGSLQHAIFGEAEQTALALKAISKSQISQAN